MVQLANLCAYGTTRPTGDMSPACEWCPVRRECRRLWDRTSGRFGMGQCNREHRPNEEVIETWRREFEALRGRTDN